MIRVWTVSDEDLLGVEKRFRLQFLLVFLSRRSLAYRPCRDSCEREKKVT
jgi:hypothetical protein